MTTRIDPRKSAEELLEEFGAHKPPVPVDLLAEFVGAQLVHAKAPASESGFVLREPGRKVIGVNSATSRRRQRFTIAHEIGHLRLHKGNRLIIDKTIRVNFRDDLSSLGTDQEERDANAFAAALLMPRAWIMESARALIEQGATRDSLTADLAREYDVSTEAMNYRLINLGIASA